MDNEKMKEYESPSTKKTQVELEDGICAASAEIKNPNTDNGRILEHEVNDGFKYEFENKDWD